MVLVIQMCKQTMVGARAAYVINERGTTTLRAGSHIMARRSPRPFIIVLVIYAGALPLS
jgi:hypothetical protein